MASLVKIEHSLVGDVAGPCKLCRADGTLAPPFDRWPHWAVELDKELSDRIGDILIEAEAEDGDAEGDPVSKARLDELNFARRKLKEMMAYRAVTPSAT